LSQWRKTLREEGIEKEKEKEDRERTKRGVENPTEVVEVIEWRRAA